MMMAVFTTNPVSGDEYYHGIMEVVWEVRCDGETLVAFDNQTDAMQKAAYLSARFPNECYEVVRVEKA